MIFLRMWLKMTESRNEVIFDKTNKIFVKRFSSKERFVKEICARETFANHWIIPKILDADEHNLEIRMEYIVGEPLEETINRLDLCGFIDFLDRLKKNPYDSRRVFREETQYDLGLVVRKGDLAVSDLHQLDFNDLFLIHGDFRPYNIVYAKGEYCLFDFEFAQNGVIEKDIAKFYLECLSLNPLLAEQIRSYTKSTFNYFNFLFYCSFISHKQLETGLYNRCDVERFICQVREEVKTIGDL